MSGFTADCDYVVGVVGATGAVGIEVAKCLYKRKFQLSKLRMFASARSAGKVVTTDFGDIVIEEYTLSAARECNMVFLAVSGDFALQNAREMCAGDGPVVIDNSSAFRYMPEIPLVVRVSALFHNSIIHSSFFHSFICLTIFICCRFQR